MMGQLPAQQNALFYEFCLAKHIPQDHLIERAIPEIGIADRAALSVAAQKSSGVLADMQAEKKRIQWEHSYVASDKTFCVYLADNDALIAEHDERSGFPATGVTRVRSMIDTVTAES